MQMPANANRSCCRTPHRVPAARRQPAHVWPGRGRASTLPLRIRDPRIQPGVEQIRREVHEDRQRGYQEERALGEGIVLGGDGLDEEAAEAGPAEDVL